MANLKVEGIKGLEFKEIESEIDRGAKFVIYTSVISILVMTFKNPSPIIFVRGTESRMGRGISYTLTSMLLGWWGFPWGFVYTPIAIINNLAGGKDVTPEVMAEFEAAEERRENRKRLAEQQPPQPAPN